MYIESFKDIFVDARGNYQTLDINPVRRVGGVFGHWGDGPKYLVHVNGLSGQPDGNNLMVLKIFAPIDGRDEEAAKPSIVMRKQPELKAAGLIVADPILRTTRDDMLLMEDLTQNGLHELVDFMTVHTFIEKSKRGETGGFQLPPWFMEQKEHILDLATQCAVTASQAGYFLDLDSYFALRNRKNGIIRVAVGDLGHGVKKPDANQELILEESTKVLYENFALRLKLAERELESGPVRLTA